MYVDGTVGGGGHAAALCRRSGGACRLVCFDMDEEAIAEAAGRLEGACRACTFVHANMRHLARELGARGMDPITGLLLDLGVSFHQVDDPGRGFSYRFDAPLDARMDRRSGRTAADVVNGMSEEALEDIVRMFGEERHARRIARRIV
ncbi:MAG: 16S rRNA (cytosine(1402)-N(4))-methyltransferase, partial [Bacteroidota bacterium]